MDRESPWRMDGSLEEREDREERGSSPWRDEECRPELPLPWWRCSRDEEWDREVEWA